MFLVEWLLPLLVLLTVGYGGAAYRYGLPSPITSRHDRCLASIQRLEIELGYRQSPEEIAYQERKRQLEERNVLQVRQQTAQIQANPYRSLISRAYGAHDTVDVSKIDPKDRNPHQQDYPA